MAEKKPFKYYAIRVGGIVLFRRTVGTLQRVRSSLYRPRTDFKLEQVTYTGGKVVSCMPYSVWVTRFPGSRLASAIQLTKEQYRSLDAYMFKQKPKQGKGTE
jgi:hypothetical protein